MTEEERNKVIAHLKKEKIKVEEKIEGLRELTQPISPDSAIGRVSRMDAINNKSVNEAALRQAEEKLNKIIISLEQSGAPDFGKCKSCGAPIPMGRLIVMPGSSLCVKCAGQ